MVIRIGDNRPSPLSNAHPENHTGDEALPASVIELSLSGIVEESMWPGKQIEWRNNNIKSLKGDGSGRPSNSIAMDIFASVSAWVDTETGGSTDIFGMHNVVWKGVL